MPTSFPRDGTANAETSSVSLGARMKRRIRILTPAGRYFLLMTFVILVIGVHRRINLLMLLGYSLLMMAGLNLLFAGRGLRRLQGRRRLGEWLFAQTPSRVEVQVNNTGLRTLWGLRIEEDAGNELASQSMATSKGSPRSERGAAWFVDALSSGGTLNWQREVMVPRRGRCTWGAIQAVSGYPFGFVESRVVLVPEESTLVLPRLGWVHRGRFLRHLRGLSVKPQPSRTRHTPRPHPAAQAEFHGLRTYQSGDSPRLIHWRTSARRGELMVREFEDEPSDNLLVFLDPTLPAESDYCGVPLREQFEEVICLTATICWEWCRRRDDRLIVALASGEPVVLDGVTGPTHARRILESLAVLECATGPARDAVIARLQAHRLPSALVVMIALGHSTLTDALGVALGRRVNVLDATRTDRFDFYTPPA